MDFSTSLGQKATVCIKELKDIWVVYNHYETLMTELHSDLNSNRVITIAINNNDDNNSNSNNKCKE